MALSLLKETDLLLNQEFNLSIVLNDVMISLMIDLRFESSVLYHNRLISICTFYFGFAWIGFTFVHHAFMLASILNIRFWLSLILDLALLGYMEFEKASLCKTLKSALYDFGIKSL